MKKLLLLTLLSCATSAPVWAQNPVTTPRPQAAPAGVAPAVQTQGTGRITGTIVDAETSKPVEFATIALIQTATGKTVDGTVTDDKGRFTLSRVANGSYTLNISFIGYETKEMKQVTISDGDQTANLNKVPLAPAQTKLQEVTVVGEKPLIEDKVDRLVYNAEKDITNTGGTAADVMQKVPSISLDQDGNIQMRGSGNVRVLINGKPSTMMAGSVADALKQIPADIIKNVEVITSPSSKYDAEGTAGIINIVTKKNSLAGITGSTTLTAGTRGSNGNANVSVRQGKLGVNVNAGATRFYSKGTMDQTQISQQQDLETEEIFENTTTQLGTSTVDGMFGFGQLGLDYDINEKNTLSAGIRVNSGEFKLRSHQLTNTFEAAQNEAKNGFLAPRLTDKYNLSMKNNNNRLSMDLNLDYTHQFKKPQQELTLLALYSQTDQDNSMNLGYYELEGPLRFNNMNENEGLNKELTFQADYAHPMPKNTLLEVGAKGILRDVSSESLYNGVDLNGAFTYDQNVLASYVSYGFNLNKKTALRLGGRYEYTDVAGDFVNPEQDFATNYDNFIPNITLAYDLKPNMKLRTTFTQRIQRPQLFFLNPYRQQQGLNVTYGNPELDAELTNSYEINYSTFFKTTSVNVSAYMRTTDNAIESVSEVVNNITYTTFNNIAKNKTYGMSLSGSTKPIPAWNINGNINLYYVDLNAPLASNDGLMYNINVSSGYTIGKGVSAQFSGGFNSSRVQLQGEASSFSYHNLAIRKELFEKKGGISLGMDNPFRRALTFDNRLAGRNQSNVLPFSTNSEIKQYNRGFRLTFEYRFGKMQQQGPPKRKKSIRNDDAKQGDSNGGVQ
ncbi:TonB-dependent receptor domain-containing protein [Rufibacter sediminis]|uniref:TonB-dependent receptor n=1 Tax=Rufibacter sediminis TaxID=2762756 RepID=A0ABR6VN15_9BACT|nr:outer membrane beta-barrel family protein [Rufibacter sediminis]MBC3538478.1 TonB-dependent receptor [Rufibacter sediminis]